MNVFKGSMLVVYGDSILIEPASNSQYSDYVFQYDYFPYYYKSAWLKFTKYNGRFHINCLIDKKYYRKEFNFVPKLNYSTINKFQLVLNNTKTLLVGKFYNLPSKIPKILSIKIIKANFLISF